MSEKNTTPEAAKDSAKTKAVLVTELEQARADREVAEEALAKAEYELTAVKAELTEAQANASSTSEAKPQSPAKGDSKDRQALIAEKLKAGLTKEQAEEAVTRQEEANA